MQLRIISAMANSRDVAIVIGRDLKHQLQIVVDPQSFLNVRVNCSLALIQNESTVAEFADKVGIVRCENEGPVTTLLEQFVMALMMEVCVSYHDNLIDQVAIKFDREG